MLKFELMREELKSLITPKTVFVCIGTKNAVFDSFGPLCGTLLQKKGVPCYGTKKDMINAATMGYKLNQIYEKDKINDEDIISIDACVTRSDKKINAIEIRDKGIKPGAAVGYFFPVVGKKSIVMYTLTKSELRDTLAFYNAYGLGSFVGKRCDPADRKIIQVYADKLTDLIAEIYHEVCSMSVI